MNVHFSKHKAKLTRSGPEFRRCLLVRFVVARTIKNWGLDAFLTGYIVKYTAGFKTLQRQSSEPPEGN